MLQRLQILLFFVLLLNSYSTKAQTYIPGGALNSIDWTNAGSPYIIQGNITVTGNIKIGPGVKVQVDGYYRITVFGDFRIEGSELDPVSFSALDTTGWSSDSTTSGGWRGIYGKENFKVDSSYIKHCVIKDTKSRNSGTPTEEAALRIEGDVLLDHCEIFHNKHNGIGANEVINLVTLKDNEKITIKNCYIHDNIGNSSIILYKGWTAGSFQMKNSRISNNTTGVTCQLLEADALIENNEFDNNKITDHFSAVIWVDKGVSILRGNKVHHNTTYKSAAITCRNSQTIIEKNLVCNNHMTYGNCGMTDGGGGIHLYGHVPGLGGAEQYIVRDNIIANNKTEYYGGGLYIMQCKANIYGNTIVNNYSYEIRGSGIAIFGNSSVKFNNNIISGNESIIGSNEQLFFAGQTNFKFDYNYMDIPIHQGIYYSGDIIGDTNHCVIGTNLNMIDPTISANYTEDATVRNFGLLSTSSCIDAGDSTITFAGHTDYDYEARIWGLTIDIGAKEFVDDKGSVGMNELTISNERVYPNPYSDSFIISGISNQDQVVIFNGSGKQVGSFYGNQSPDLSHLGRGIYFLNVISEKSVKSIKIIKD